VVIEIKGLSPLSPQDIGSGVQNKSSVTELHRPQLNAPGSASADKVSLTPISAHLRGLEQALTDYPVVDMQQVETIRQSLAQGSYQVDAQRIAFKLINLEGSLQAKG
jgi:negative regulator of flagellin synthesis FlgM